MKAICKRIPSWAATLAGLWLLVSLRRRGTGPLRGSTLHTPHHTQALIDKDFELVVP
jgi:hypothetical protein